MNKNNAVLVYDLIRDHDGAILLALESTGEMAGMYTLPSGLVLPSESYSAATVRVAQKEVGVTLDQNEVGFTYMQQRYEAEASDGVSVLTDIFFEAGPWKGEPHNTDPEEQTKIVWFYADELPENMAPHERYAIERITGEHIYGEYGWPSA